MLTPALLTIRDLTVSYGRGPASARVVDGVSIDLEAGEAIGVVGESGSGKSQLFLAVAGLSPTEARVSGSVKYLGAEMIGIAPVDRRQRLGRDIALVFQNPMTSLTPHLRIGEQLTEGLIDGQGVARPEAEQRARVMLEMVRLSDPRARMRQYPHELSGGMRQRVLLAMALLARPRLLIADEPTTALDVTTQAEILTIIDSARRELGFGLVFVTHDLSILPRICQRLCVMRGGKLVEQGPVDVVLHSPTHAYTRGLVDAARSLAL